MRLPAATSASSMITASAVWVAFSGTGLHPPAVPTDCGLIGAAQFLQTTPLGPLKNQTKPKISQGSNTGATLRPGFDRAKTGSRSHSPSPGNDAGRHPKPAPAG